MKRLSVSMAFALGALTLGAAVLPYGTHLVKGTFVGNYNTVLRDDVTAKVRAQRSDGTASPLRRPASRLRPISRKVRLAT